MQEILEEQKFEKRGVDYFLGDTQISSVSTIIGSGGGGKASANGNAFHEAMANYFLGNFTKEDENVEIDEFGYILNKKPTIKGLFDDCNPEDFKIAENLSKFLLENGLKPKYVEYPFIAEIQGCKYAGTIDLVCEDSEGRLYVFDYKTGTSKTDKHKLQIAAYALGIKSVRGAICYREKVEDFFNLGTEETEEYLNEFENLLLAYYGKLDGKIWHNGNVYNVDADLTTDCEQLKNLIQAKNAMEDDINELKDYISSHLNESGLKNEHFLVSYVKPKINKTLKKEAKQKLLKEHPEFFEEKEVDGYFNYKIQGE
ncbi:MAG: PD-(D/E)XK nuclease family protein [Alphaproteobacteria bacterium]|nr:PD-(D/E)XK nuclease family protein [Alphaproteobacteria bacterium]